MALTADYEVEAWRTFAKLAKVESTTGKESESWTTGTLSSEPVLASGPFATLDVAKLHVMPLPKWQRMPRDFPTNASGLDGESICHKERS
jgi:hypothetical protein